MNLPIRDNSRLDDDDIIEMARGVEAHDFDRIAPPPMVWNNVLAEVEVARADQEATARRQSQRWFSSPRLLSMAAATLLLVGIAAAVVTSWPTEETGPIQVASATLSDDGLPVSTTETAQAIVACDDDGCYVDVDLTALPEAGDDALELWVINQDVTDMFSLGEVTSSGRFNLPLGVTTTEFPIVDISIEPRDGDATHSGKSVLRGVLEQA